MSPDGREGGLTVRDQIERYRSAFIAVISMIAIAAVVGGYILSHENLKLPSWVPVLGHSYYTLNADIQTAQAVTPGQGQAVTIAGAKIGEIASVDLHDGIATMTMKITPKYARLYRNATLLLRPKTQLQDITVEVNPGSPGAGRLPSGSTLPLAQTAPNVNFDEFLSSLDAETRAYLQELLAGAGEGLKNNGKAFAATLKRFAPTARPLGPANEATRRLAKETTPVIRDEIRPFARQILPTISELRPDTQALAESFPKLATVFSVLNEFFNELAYNPGAKQGGFLFFLDWSNHNLNSVVSSADAHGVLGRTLVYLNCEILGLLKGASEINPTVNLLVGLLKPPTKAECQAQGIPVLGAAASVKASAARAHSGPVDRRARAAARAMLSKLGLGTLGSAPASGLPRSATAGGSG